MAWTTYAISLPFLISIIWLYALTTSSPPLVNKNITLLIAHPDDEAMFFAPTLLALGAHNTIRVLCLSSGDADGLGATRKLELAASCRTLGVGSDGSSAGAVTVIEDAALPDSMTATWDAGVVAAHLRRHAAAADVDVVVTFDARGVSGHPNHVALLHGARKFVRAAAPTTTTRLLTLASVSLLRKYVSVLDAPVTVWEAAAAARGGARERLLFVSTAAQVRTAQRAMTDAHKSQMRWFRWGWIGLSRYMVVNDLREE